MTSVFSHIVRSRLSSQSEDVATDALWFILSQSQSVRNEFLRILQDVVPELPALVFEVQQQEDNARPDIAGVVNGKSRIFLENKFWAGLTDNQPVKYLRMLSQSGESSGLIFVVPGARTHTIWQELRRRILAEKIDVGDLGQRGLFKFVATTSLGPIIAVTSWRPLLLRLESAVSDDPTRRNDIVQLLALCEAVDSEAFLPWSAEEISDQRTPRLILQLTNLIDEINQRAASRGLVSFKGLRPQASSKRIGRYMHLHGGVTYFWFGLHFRLWKEQGITPLWMLFCNGQGVADIEDVAKSLSEWFFTHEITPIRIDDALAVPIRVTPGAEKDTVIENILATWREIASEVNRTSKI